MTQKKSTGSVWTGFKIHRKDAENAEKKRFFAVDYKANKSAVGHGIWCSASDNGGESFVSSKNVDNIIS